MSREGADARLGRLLCVVPWIAAREGPRIEEVCRRFGVAERELLADLELLFLCGVYPYTPDVLIDVDIADGRVWIRMADYFRRPLRLTPQEALALVSAGELLLEVPEASADLPLATALDKLHEVLGIEREGTLTVELPELAPGLLDGLRRAVRDHEKVRIEYYSFGRDGRSNRVVRPWRVFTTAGQWYLDAWCENVTGARLFRVDRILEAEPTGESFDPSEVPAGGDLPALYHPGEDDLLWVLDLEPPAHWVAEQYPMEAVESKGGGILRVTMRAAPAAWMERVLLRAGPHATVIEGDASIGPAAARRLLGRYRGTVG